MKNINLKEINALIHLLDDPSIFVYNEVKAKIKMIGIDSYPYLASALKSSDDELKSERLMELISDFKYDKLVDDYNVWMSSSNPSLWEGCMLIARYGYPDLDEDTILAVLNTIEQKIGKQIYKTDNTSNSVDIMNQVILDEFNFSPNKSNYSDPNNSFINKVIELRKGNPISLCIIYLLIAERLKIPLVGINSPMHFIIGFHGQNEKSETKPEFDSIRYFVDPFHKGARYQTQEFERYLENRKFDKKYISHLVTSPPDIIHRMINNLIVGFKESGDDESARQLLRFAAEYLQSKE